MSKRTYYMRCPSGEVFATTNPEYHNGCENLGSGDKGYAARQAYAREKLREFIKPGDVVYANVRSVSASGMSRTISFYVICSDKDDGRPYLRNIDALMSDACAMRGGKNGGVVLHGCGMDMVFAGVYSLGRVLFPEGFGTVGKDAMGRTVRPLTKAKAKAAQSRGFVFRGRNGDTSGWDNDGGYALRYTTL